MLITSTKAVNNKYYFYSIIFSSFDLLLATFSVFM